MPCVRSQPSRSARARRARSIASGARAKVGALVACLASTLLGVPSVSAHGAVPRASAPLASGASGVALVQLTRGLAVRAADGFRYYCPAHWDDNENDLAAPLAPGAALLALASGLYLVSADGSVTNYPEPDLGITVALASTSTAAYALSLRASTYEVRRISADHSDLLWSAPQSAGDWLTLGASDQSLLLLGLDRGKLSQLALSSTGSELGRATAAVGMDALTVQAQLVGSTPYVIVQYESGDRIELGRIASGQWSSLARATGNLAGPIQTSDGKLLVAIDGALASFDDEHVTPVGGSDFVTGLARFGDDSYASVRQGLALITAGRPAAVVFDFATLAEPLYSALSPAERTACVTSWQHLQVDLVASGFTGLDPTRDAGAQLDGAAGPASATPDASPPPPHVGAAGSDADAGAASASADPHAAHDAAIAAGEPAGSGGGGGCTVGAAHSPARDGALACALLALGALRRGRRPTRERRPKMGTRSNVG